MKTMPVANRGVAVIVFFAIAVLARYYLVVCKPQFLAFVSQGLLYAVFTGVGPFIGGMVAIYVLRRKKMYSIFGTSVVKSTVSVACPVLLFALLDVIKEDYSFACVKIVTACIVYAYFEEYGWRGYLQSELMGISKWYRISVIAVLWFVWHLNFECSMSNLLFFAILLFGTWGIGQIVIKTQSIVLCACFHSVINIMQNVELTIAVISVLLLCVVLWFSLWYGKYCALFK